MNNAFAGDHIHIVPEMEPSRSDKRGIKCPRAGHLDRDLRRCFSSVFGPVGNAERRHYAEAVHEGKAVVAVSTPYQMVERAAEILNHHAPVEAVLSQVVSRSHGS